MISPINLAFGVGFSEIYDSPVRYLLKYLFASQNSISIDRFAVIPFCLLILWNKTAARPFIIRYEEMR
jgi:hypothetical protein